MEKPAEKKVPVEKNVKAVSALIILIAVMIGLSIFLVVSNSDKFNQKIGIKSTPKVTSEESTIKKLITTITGSSTEKDSTQEPTVPTSSDVKTGGGGGKTEGISGDEGTAQEMISKKEAEDIGQDFICDIAACSSTILNSYLEGKYWRVEIRDNEDNTTDILSIDAYTGEIIG